MKLVYVEWLDHCGFDDDVWRSEEEYDDLEPQLCRTTGWLLKDEKDYIIIVSTIHLREDDGYDNKYCGNMCILKGCIKTMKELKV